MYDIIVIGAGITGLAIARRLSRYDLKICVLDKEPDVAMGATKANSAIVHGGYAESHSKLKGRLCYKGRIQFEQLNKELNFGFRETGSLLITTDTSDLPKLEAMLENAKLNDLSDLEIIHKDKILELEPNINPKVEYALYCKGAGICSPYEMAVALAENAVANGTELILNEEVTGVSNEESYLLVKTPNREISGRFVVNCSGISSAHISKMAAPTLFTVKPRSGEYLLFARGTGSLLNTVIFQMPTRMGKGILAAPTYHGNLLLGPDAIDEEGCGNRSTHVERLAAIYKQGLNITDKIDVNKYIRSFAGLRAVASTDDFIIEMSETRGFINVAGIQSPGLTSSPAIADMVTDILENAGLELIPDQNYNPYRKPVIITKEMLSMSEANKLANLPPSPERLICRCEQVPEKVIVDSLHRGIQVTTVDGVKRRTRASMGYCQGNFCRPRIKELIEREYNIDIDGLSDVEREGAVRVTKQELLSFLAENKGT